MTELNPELKQLVSQANAHYGTGPAELQRVELSLKRALEQGVTGAVQSEAVQSAGELSPAGRYLAPQLIGLSVAALGCLALIMALSLPKSFPKSPSQDASTKPVETQPVPVKVSSRMEPPAALIEAMRKSVGKAEKPKPLPLPVAAVVSRAAVKVVKADGKLASAKRVVANKTSRAKSIKRIRDAEYMPIFRTKPMYPREAIDRKIEGWVDLRYTVTSRGRVVNPVVIRSKPPKFFDRAARICVRKWKYRPKRRNGKFVNVPGVETRIAFRLRDAN